MTHKHRQCRYFCRFKKLGFALLLLTVAGLFSACTHVPSRSLVEQIPEHDWKYEFIHYNTTIPAQQRETAEKLLAISPEMRQNVQTLFGGLAKLQAAEALANWIVAPDGLGLEYVSDANLTPRQAYQQKEANCLSYTLLLTQLAAALDIHIQINSVDTPNIWDLDDNTLLFYRHVNGLYEKGNLHAIFDLTPSRYDEQYPHNTLGEQEAFALFLSNRSIDHFLVGENDRAMHLIKMATSLSPNNPDIWTNLGAILKRGGEKERAKDALHFALSLDQTHVVAVSQLERLYREDNDLENAERYAALAKKVRTSNPYYLYKQSINYYLKKNYRQAYILLGDAIRKHRHDPRFFALRGKIEYKTRNFKAAQRSFEKASKVTRDLANREKYITKAKRIASLVQPDLEKQVDLRFVNQIQ